MIQCMPLHPLAGQPAPPQSIIEVAALVRTRASANGAAISGLKVATASSWFAARPSGTDDVYKLYAESFRSAEHLAAIVREAQAIVAAAFT
jgi:phosphoglucomutase